MPGTNIRGGDNPPFDLAEFLSLSPQFGAGAVPVEVLEMYLALADEAIKIERWRSYWKMATVLFTAHFATLWTQSAADPTGDAAGVLKAGAARGLTTSKSVDSVSVSTDYSAITQDMAGWGAWKLTTYGTQLITLARMAGKGGMQIW
jgi:hypothetical protein